MKNPRNFSNDLAATKAYFEFVLLDASGPKARHRTLPGYPSALGSSWCDSNTNFVATVVGALAPHQAGVVRWSGSYYWVHRLGDGDI